MRNAKKARPVLRAAGALSAQEVLLLTALDADIPVLITGHPGTGKTSAINQLAAQQGACLITLIASQLADSTYIHGQPVYASDEKNIVLFSQPWVKKAQAALKAGQAVWVFVDEMTCLPLSIQAALLGFFYERVAGSVSLKGCRILGAGNPCETATDGGFLAPATNNRFCHFEWQVDVAQWVHGTCTNWGKGYLTTENATLASEVAAFIKANPSALLAEENVMLRQSAWASPRSWTAGITMLNAYAAKKHLCDTELRINILKSNVGPVALEYFTWVKELDLPSPADLLSGAVPLPTRGDRLAAALLAVAAYALTPASEQPHRLEKTWALLATCRPDLAINAASLLLKETHVVPDEGVALAKRIREAQAALSE